MPDLFSRKFDQFPKRLRNPGLAHLSVKSQGWEQSWHQHLWLLPERVLVPGLNQPLPYVANANSPKLLVVFASVVL